MIRPENAPATPFGAAGVGCVEIVCYGVAYLMSFHYNEF